MGMRYNKGKPYVNGGRINEIFLDTANVDEIREAAATVLSMEFTNPTLIAKEGGT